MAGPSIIRRAPRRRRRHCTRGGIRRAHFCWSLIKKGASITNTQQPNGVAAATYDYNIDELPNEVCALLSVGDDTISGNDASVEDARDAFVGRRGRPIVLSRGHLDGVVFIINLHSVNEHYVYSALLISF